MANYCYENVIITRVVDGDTFEADIDLGFTVRVKKTIRLFDVDTPETHRPKTEAERKHGKEATAFVKSKIEGKRVILVSHKGKKGKYGRWLAEVLYAYEDNNRGMRFVDLGLMLKDQNLVKRESYPEDEEE